MKIVLYIEIYSWAFFFGFWQRSCPNIMEIQLGFVSTNHLHKRFDYLNSNLNLDDLRLNNQTNHIAKDINNPYCTSNINVL